MHLLNMMSVKNCVVVVSRWYGGILLGPARFKHINNVARKELEKYGFGGGKHKKKIKSSTNKSHKNAKAKKTKA